MTDREKMTGLVSDILEYLPWGQISSSTAREVADHMIDNGVTVQKWIPVSERLPVEREEDDEGEKHTASDIVQVAVMDSLGNKFVSDDMLYDGKWVNYPWGDFEITHWMPLPEPPKEVE